MQQHAEFNEFVQEHVHVPVRYAYHVTNVSFADIQQPPPLSQLRRSIANDPFFDGPLLGKQCVFFSTTLYRNGLPTISVYPRDGVVGQHYWRVCVPINHFDQYKIWLCHDKGDQVLLAMTRGPEETIMQELQATHPSITDNPQVVGRYLRRVNQNGRFVYYCNEYEEVKRFVNIAVFHDIDVSRSDWDAVPKN